MSLEPERVAAAIEVAIEKKRAEIDRERRMYRTTIWCLKDDIRKLRELRKRIAKGEYDGEKELREVYRQLTKVIIL